MFDRKLVAAGVAGALGLIVAAAPVHAGPVTNRALEIVGAGAAADPLIAVEANRSAIVDRIVADHADVIATMGNGAEAALRTALAGLRADQLLAASLVGSLAEITAIISGQSSDGAALQRFVALAPAAPSSALPSAQAYLVSNADTLTIVAAADLAASGGQVVGYFTPTVVGTMVTAAAAPIAPKDGSGTGAGSWIGYTAGGNVASGSGSAVGAGKFNAATNTNASIFAGQSNEASGVSSLVIGGFDNHAQAIDALVGAGAGNRVTGARSIVVGGGYNLASGQFSFIGGGGRDGAGSTIAGSDPKDNIASGNFSVVTGGQGNRATSVYATVAGGGYNTASGNNATVGGGGASPFPNTASGGYSTVGGGAQNTAAGTSSTISGGYLNSTSLSADRAVVGGGFNNQATGSHSVVPGGFQNVASGTYSVAMGAFALTQDLTPTPHNGAFVFSDGSSGNFRSTANNQFNVLATGGIRLITAATNPSGEAVPTNQVLIQGGQLQFPETTQGRQAIQLRDGINQGMGAQPFTLYLRTNSDIGFFVGGTHSDGIMDPGTGGQLLATLTDGASSSTVVGTFRALVVTATSDRNQKTAFEPVDAKAVLARVNALPITTWSFKNEAPAGIRHIGPMSQDFKQAFEVGADDKSITTVDEGGVALAAIQGLYAELKDRDATIAAQAGQIDALQRKVTELVAAQEDVKVMKAALVELLRGRSELGTLVRLIGSGAALPGH